MPSVLEFLIAVLLEPFILLQEALIEGSVPAILALLILLVFGGISIWYYGNSILLTIIGLYVCCTLLQILGRGSKP